MLAAYVLLGVALYGFSAVQEAQLEAGADLLAAGANEASDGASPPLGLYWAGSLEDTATLSQLIAAGGLVNETDSDGLTPLHFAAENDSGASVKMLLDAGASIAAVTTSGATPLHLAVLLNKAAPARALIEAGASARGEYPDRLRKRWSIPGSGMTHLHVAASRGLPEVAAALIEAGADVEATDAAGRTPLHRAAAEFKEGDEDGVAELLIEAGANVEATDDNGLTPLHVAVSYSRLARAEALLDAGADANASAVGATPLHIAARRGCLGCAELLLRYGATVDPPRRPGLGSPLLVAVENSWSHIATVLVENGADANARDENGETAAGIAKRKGMKGVLVRLLEADESLRARDVDPELLVRLLSRAVERDAPGAVLRLLDGVDAERLAFAPLHEAAGRGSLRVAEALLDVGYDANVGTALVPVYSPDRDYPLLARAGDAGGAKLFRPLHMAVRHESVAVAARLIERGAEINARDGVGWTPLHHALLEGVERPALQAANLLLEHGADVHAATLVMGWTPLHLAARLSGSRVSWLGPLETAEYAQAPDVLRLVQTLIERGADVRARTHVGGWTPARVAKESDERRRHPRRGLRPGESSQAVLAALEAAGGKNEGCWAGASAVPFYVLGKAQLGDKHAGWRLSAFQDDVPGCEYDMPFAMPSVAARGPREAAGSFTAPDADERLLLQTTGVLFDAAYHQLASLQDRHGAVRPVVFFGRQTAYQGLCFDRETATHTAIFTHIHGRGDGGWPKTTYFHYDANAGTLVEAFVEEGQRALPIGRDEACRWREKTTGLDGYEGVLKALEAEHVETSRRRLQVDAETEDEMRADAEALARRTLYLESDEFLLDEAGLAELTNELAGVLSRLKDAYPELADFRVRRDQPNPGEIKVRLRPQFAQIVRGVLQDFPHVGEKGRPIALRTGHRVFDGLNEKLGLWKVDLYNDESAIFHLHKHANVWAAARAYSVLEVVEEAKPRKLHLDASYMVATRSQHGEGWEIWIVGRNCARGCMTDEDSFLFNEEIVLFIVEGDTVEIKTSPEFPKIRVWPD